MFPILVGVLLPMILVVAMAMASGPEGPWHEAAAGVLLLPAVAALMALAFRSREVVLFPDGRLQVRRWPVPKCAAATEFDLARARVVDLSAEPTLRPTLEISGSRLPGFASGTFRLKDKRRAYVLLTDYRRVLVLPRHDGEVWLLGVERADALLAALRAQR